MMQGVEKSIEIARPVRMCYNQWTQFESFPAFMAGVKSVEQLDDKRLRWTAAIAGKAKTWEAEITYQEPDERIAWKSTAGPHNEGSVTFKPLGAEKCLVALSLSFEPEGAGEALGAAVGVVRARVEGDLRRFKKFIEGRPAETGAWRGEIKNRQVKRTGSGRRAGTDHDAEARRKNPTRMP